MVTSGGCRVTGATLRRFRSADRDFDSTTAGMGVTVQARSVDGRTCGGDARSPRHTGPRSFATAVERLDRKVIPLAASPRRSDKNIAVIANRARSRHFVEHCGRVFL